MLVMLFPSNFTEAVKVKLRSKILTSFLLLFHNLNLFLKCVWFLQHCVYCQMWKKKI